MNYENKYHKYKLKYLSLKNKLSSQSGGGSDKLVGINFEGGKIISHIKKFKNCVAYANCQIVMDAPYHIPPRVADESVRSLGRSESQFKGYDEEKLKNKLGEILNFIKDKYADTKLVIQIARGRSAEPTFNEVLKPVLDKIGISNIETKYGYRSGDYYKPLDEKPFVFLNYGMYAELSEGTDVTVGEICNPVTTYAVNSYFVDQGFKFENKAEFGDDSKNILNNITDIKKLVLFGIADEMKFITPEEYKKIHIIKMVEKV
jgi:hypothetical protein